jgi:surfeit locus 1 family protein
MTTSTPALPLRRLIIPVFSTLICFSLLVGLGSWQIERMGAKQRLIARVDARINGPALPLPPRASWSALSAKANDYMHVTLTGRLMNDREAYLYMLRETDEQNAVPGYGVITPVKLADGAIVLVNRGFVPQERRDPATRPLGQIETPVTITGLLRLPEPRGLFAAPDDPGKRLFYTRDPLAIASAIGLQGASPFIVDADATPVPGGWPKGGNTRVQFSDNHLQYAITWFTLAIAVLAMFVLWYRRARGEEAQG